MTSSEESGTVSKQCPVCAGCGTTDTGISRFYPAKINMYEQGVDAKGNKKYRIRLEIPRAFHGEFMEAYSHGDEIATFIIPMESTKKKLSDEQIESIIEGDSD